MNEAGNLSVRVRNENGAGTPILFIHGAMGSNLVWLPLSRMLAERLPDRPGYLIDLPGHGATDGSGCDRIEQYADAVVAYLDSRGISRAALIGHSMGGAISQQVAHKNPERVAQLALLATGARLSVADFVFQALAADFEGAVEMVRGFVFGPGASESFIKPAIEQMKQVGQTVALGDFTACSKFDSVDWIGSIQTPTIVCCGDQDKMTPPKLNQRLAESLGCHYSEYPETGHMIQLEQTQSLADELSDFFAAPVPEDVE
jgi:3-oxoadipate enol-lactonase